MKLSIATCRVIQPIYRLIWNDDGAVCVCVWRVVCVFVVERAAGGRRVGQRLPSSWINLVMCVPVATSSSAPFLLLYYTVKKRTIFHE